MKKKDGKPENKNGRHKPWQGRFTAETAKSLEAFTASVGYDHRLYACDIEGSIAHARALEKAGVLSAAEATAIVEGLTRIREEIERGEFVWSQALEDVHMNIEARLINLIGDVGKKLHTGRSRNDQVATDLRLYLRGQMDELQAALTALQTNLVALAQREADSVMPGFTHLQVAQPVSFGHHLLAWFEMLKRDRSRLNDLHARINVLPLGAAALAGTAYPLDRQYMAELLGFDAVSDNSLDAVSDRDFVIEVCAICSIVMMHLSRFGEELVLWTSRPFSFVELPDAYCTGSSIMPQKKNPDAAELVRGKAGRVFGDLVALLTLMKGQPLAYNRDNQEDKEPVFDAVDTTLACVRIMAEVMAELRVNRKRMAAMAETDCSTATDLADYLVGKGIPFRDAHAVTGRIVQAALDQQCSLGKMALGTLQALCPQIEDDVYPLLTAAGSVARRNAHGGTALEQVHARIADAKHYLKSQGISF